jgi:RNA polymerase sigma-70 factor (TIGR02960 family)
LLDRARRGDEGAFRGLIEPHRTALHAHCYQLLGSPHDAEDALQETLLRAWRALPKFRGGSQLRTWLRRIATNVCLDAIRDRRKRVLPLDYGTAVRAGDDQSGQTASHAPWIEAYHVGTVGGADGAAPLEARYEQREALELAFIAALHHLPARQRSALILRDALGFSAKEAADALATTVASVNGALLRARRATEERLLDEGPQPTPPTFDDRRLRVTAERCANAFERGEIDAVLALLADPKPVSTVHHPEHRPADRSTPRAGRGKRNQLRQGGLVRILAYDRFKPGVTMEMIEPYLPDEVANVWRLWKAGIVRENYARADEPGVVIVFELDSVDDARRYTGDFPLTKAGFLEWSFIPLMVPLPIESLFRSEIDIGEPYDRTATVAS